MLSSSLRMELKTVRGNSNRIYFVLKPWHPISQIHSKWSLKFQKRSQWRKLKTQASKPLLQIMLMRWGHISTDSPHLTLYMVFSQHNKKPFIWVCVLQCFLGYAKCSLMRGKGIFWDTCYSHYCYFHGCY